MNCSPELEDAIRDLMCHLEEFCGFPEGDRERKLQKAIYVALGDEPEE